MKQDLEPHVRRDDARPRRPIKTRALWAASIVALVGVVVLLAIGMAGVLSVGDEGSDRTEASPAAPTEVAAYFGLVRRTRCTTPRERGLARRPRRRDPAAAARAPRGRRCSELPGLTGRCRARVHVRGADLRGEHRWLGIAAGDPRDRGRRPAPVGRRTAPSSSSSGTTRGQPGRTCPSWMWHHKPDGRSRSRLAGSSGKPGRRPPVSAPTAGASYSPPRGGMVDG